MTISLWQVILLAVIQGITEFLPISSSGHLVITQQLLGVDLEGGSGARLFLNVVLHAGTVLAIIVYYWRDLWRLLRRDQWPVVGMLMLGTAPVVVLVLGMKVLEKLIPGFEFDAILENAWLACVCLAGTAALLLFMHRRQPGGRELSGIGWRDALFVGLLQCLAILPGISRSGSTISAGTRRGIESGAAARFSFLLGVPAIMGAVVFELKDVLGEPEALGALPWLPLAVGFGVSFAVGCGAIHVLLRMLAKGVFARFAWYCLAAAAVGLVALTVQKLKGG